MADFDDRKLLVKLGDRQLWREGRTGLSRMERIFMPFSFASGDIR